MEPCVLIKIMGFFKNRTARLFNESLMKAEQGIPEFQVIVADMFREGAGTVSDNQKAIYWYGKASNNGNTEATYKLGVAYFRGDGVNEDIDKGIEYVELAAKDGYKMAIKTLPTMRAHKQHQKLLKEE